MCLCSVYAARSAVSETEVLNWAMCLFYVCVCAVCVLPGVLCQKTEGLSWAVCLCSVYAARSAVSETEGLSWAVCLYSVCVVRSAVSEN